VPWILRWPGVLPAGVRLAAPVGLVDVALCSLLGVLLFGVPFRGNAFFLMGASFAFPGVRDPSPG